MALTTVFRRYELKYLLTKEKRDMLFETISPYIERDGYYKSRVRNIYFDTENYLLIRRSIEKPLYKEKLRLRSYERREAGEPCFLELKKKYDGVVFKRRTVMSEREALSFIKGTGELSPRTQIEREIYYFKDLYKTLEPKVFLAYDREAYYYRDDPHLRITFDTDIMARTSHLSLSEDIWGAPLLGGDLSLMEIKCRGGMPLWLCRALSELKVYKTSFSKYGTAYKNIIFPSKMKGIVYNGSTFSRNF